MHSRICELGQLRISHIDSTKNVRHQCHLILRDQTMQSVMDTILKNRGNYQDFLLHATRNIFFTVKHVYVGQLFGDKSSSELKLIYS